MPLKPKKGKNVVRIRIDYQLELSDKALAKLEESPVWFINGNCFQCNKRTLKGHKVTRISRGKTLTFAP